MKTLIIDNYDSFTFNLYQLIAEVNGESPIVVRNDEADWDTLLGLGADNIVISPGPGRPENVRDFGVCRQAILESSVPLLGVCLGHEGIGHLMGGAVVHAPEVMHGRLSTVDHDGSELFAGIDQGFAVVRYHSLMVAQPLPAMLEPTAWTRDGILMGLRHRTRPIWGVQFHPESISTEHGRRLLGNFRDITSAFQGRTNGNGRIAFPGFSPASGRDRAAAGAPFNVSSRRLGHLHDAERAFAGLFGAEPNAFWLDSSRAEEGLSRFSFIGSATGPNAQIISHRSPERELTVTEGGATATITTGIFDYLERELAARRVPAGDLPFDFNCGYVGYFGYELKGECGAEIHHRSPYPDACFIFADRVIAFDHFERETYLVAFHRPDEAADAELWFESTARALETLRPLAEPEAAAGADRPVTFALARDHAGYLEDIAACLGEIHEGESYEICLTNQLAADIDLNPFELYRTLRRVNPAPYAAFLRFGDLSILSSSPERFLRVERDGWVESKPIKGTRPRGRSIEEDRAIALELGSCVKDRAENLMIVDLIRNDLGRACEVGSVHVPKLMDVETYATVHQLVSTIRGLLREDRSAIDCIRAAFPGGSMTGAPKLRTMEIIDRLEPGPRGIYSGAIGFLGACGAADLNIVIRTIVMTPGRATMGVGGAIVALSDPEEEFEEILLKARAQITAIARAAGQEVGVGGDTLVGV